MAETANMIQFRQQQINAFARNKSLLRSTTTTEAVFKGNQATVLIASDSATAVTRGVNGNIPYSGPDTSQVTVNLAEKHVARAMTGFNVFSSQGDQKSVLQMQAVNGMNRDIDDTIIAELATATATAGAAAQASTDLLLKARGRLRQADVTFATGDVTALITPAFESKLLAAPGFTSADYINRKPLDGTETTTEGHYYDWSGMRIIVHTGLNALGTLGTANEVCLMYHRAAIAHAANMADMDVKVGYDEKQDESWVRTTLYHGAKLIQNAGVIKILHDGSFL